MPDQSDTYTLVTDWNAPAKVVAEYRLAGLNVIVAPQLTGEGEK